VPQYSNVKDEEVSGVLDAEAQESTPGSTSRMAPLPSTMMLRTRTLRRFWLSAAHATTGAL